jgi:serine O-acetyltransferase
VKVFNLIKSDVYRYSKKSSFINCVIVYLRVPGFRFMVWHRIAHKARKNKLLYVLPWIILSRLKYKYGYDIPASTMIAPGFYIGHFGGVVISGKAIIGKNCNISQGVTIGFNPRGKNKGYPRIGDNVYLGPGAKVFGNITIGNNVAIGANAVVNCDVPSNCTYGGIPAKKISSYGSDLIIINKIN